MDDHQTPSPPLNKKSHITWSDSYTKAHNAIEALSSILPSVPNHLSSSDSPAASLLHDSDVASQISLLLRRPHSGAVDDNLCCWLYDTFHSNEPELRLVVLRFLPVLSGVYLSRAALNKPLAGFESVLLGIYAFETASRNGQALTATIPDLSHSSIYHETKQAPKNGATELHLAVISPSLEPHGTVRSTRRARIVSVALELYYSHIAGMPVSSKMEFCGFCSVWAGDHEDNATDSDEKRRPGRRGGRVDLTWDLLQPMLRVLGHCLMGPERDELLFEAASDACRCLHARAMHDINPKAIMATGSLLKLADMDNDERNDRCDHTEINVSNVISV